MSRLVAATLLRQALGFRQCEQQVIDDMVAAGHAVVLRRGEYLVRRGEPFDNLCLVVEGSLEAGVSHQDGRRHLVAYLHPGDLSGLISLWDGQPHVTDMVAREAPTRLLLLRGNDYRLLRDRYPSISRAMELQMAYRSRLLHERLLGDISMPLEVRLARVLHMQATLSGGRKHDGIRLVLKMSQAEIGNFLGVSRQRANFAVQLLKKEGLILLQYSQITIIDAAGLARRAGT